MTYCIFWFINKQILSGLSIMTDLFDESSFGKNCSFKHNVYPLSNQLQNLLWLSNILTNKEPHDLFKMFLCLAMLDNLCYRGRTFSMKKHLPSITFFYLPEMFYEFLFLNILSGKAENFTKPESRPRLIKVYVN